MWIRWCKLSQLQRGCSDPGWRKGFLSKFFLGIVFSGLVCFPLSCDSSLSPVFYSLVLDAQSWVRGDGEGSRHLASFGAEAPRVPLLAASSTGWPSSLARAVRRAKIRSCKGNQMNTTPDEIMEVEMLPSQLPVMRFEQFSEHLDLVWWLSLWSESICGHPVLCSVVNTL